MAHDTQLMTRMPTPDFGNVTTPDVHLNGTSGEALAEMYDLAAHKLNDALVALCDAAPNARDYMHNSFKRATEQHVARIEKLRGVLAELMEIRESIADQIDARTARRG